MKTERFNSTFIQVVNKKESETPNCPKTVPRRRGFKNNKKRNKKRKKLLKKI